MGNAVKSRDMATSGAKSRRDSMFITPDEIGGREAEPILLFSNSEGVECYSYLLNPFGVAELEG